MPNVEYFAPWFRSEALVRSMSYERWLTLSPHAQRLARFIVRGPDEPVVGEGFTHPRGAERQRVRDLQLEEMGGDAETYLRLG